MRFIAFFIATASRLHEHFSRVFTAFPEKNVPFFPIIVPLVDLLDAIADGIREEEGGGGGFSSTVLRRFVLSVSFVRLASTIPTFRPWICLHISLRSSFFHRSRAIELNLSQFIRIHQIRLVWIAISENQQNLSTTRNTHSNTHTHTPHRRYMGDSTL